MNLSGHYFYYGDRSSEVYGLRVLRIDTEKLKKLSADIEYKKTYNKASRSFNFNGIDYSSSPIEFEIEFISEVAIDNEAARKAKRWLFNRTKPQKLYTDIHFDDTRERIGGVIKREFLNCVFYNPTEIRYSDGLHGWKATCLADSIMAMQEEVEFSFTNFEKDITIPVSTDIDDYVYPNVIIVAGTEESDISIVNKTDNNRTMQIIGVPAQRELRINTGLGTVNDIVGASWYQNLTDRKFLRLLPGDNVISVSGSVESIRIVFSNARWLL